METTKHFNAPNESIFLNQTRSAATGLDAGLQVVAKGHVLPEYSSILSLEPHSTSVTCCGYSPCLVLNRMTPLRCLLFSSNAEVVQPIWQVLADLGIEGEYCQTAVDAVEKVTTQSFQIVITDWEDQPEAAFLLKTVRDLKAAQRPLTLAIVSDDARRPQALQAGANSILLKPIRPEQLRDTMSTACELLRSKLSVTPSPIPTPEASATMAAAASASAVSMPVSVRQSPGKIRAGEFLQSSGSAPGAEFDTEREGEAPDKPVLAEIQPVTELEPMAAATHTAAVEQLRPQEALTGWAMLQARLTTAPPRTASGSPKAELLSYGQTRSYSGPSTGTSAAQEEALAKKPWGENAEPEAKLFAYMPGEQSRSWEGTSAAPSKGGKIFILAALAVVFAGLVAAPRTRQSLLAIYRNSVRAGNGLLNPPPAALPQAVTLHDSFGQSGDEYKLPVPVNIPDATTDPSQIRVLPVIDPTAKKKTEANTGSEQAQSVENAPLPQDQNAPNQSAQDPFEQHEVPDAGPSIVGDMPRNATDARLDPIPAHTEPIQTARPPQPAQTRTPMPSPAPRPATHYVISASTATGIPSSLKSRVASSAPQASGSKPIEAAMSSIEPVNLPEPVEREFLIQPVDAVYPVATAKGQRGTVILQVLVGRDGTVQDAKFLQGSLLFARPAIDAVKQYRFKPYLLNGRPVSIQSIITLNFKPPA